MSREGRHTIDFSSLSLKDTSDGNRHGGGSLRELSFRDSDIRGSKEKSGSFTTAQSAKLRRSSFFGKGRMSSFFFGNDESDSFYFDNSATEVEKNIKRAPWYRSLSKSEKTELGLVLKPVEDEESLTLENLIQVDINPFLLQFSAFSTEMDYREKAFYKNRGEARFPNTLTILFDLSAMIYDAYLISGECSKSTTRLGVLFGLYLVFVFAPNVVVMVNSRILAFAGEIYKGLMDGLFLGSTIAVSGILKIVLLSCGKDVSDVYSYVLMYLVYYIIAKSTAFRILYQSYAFALATLIVSQVVLLALDENIFNKCNPFAIVMAAGVITLYSMSYYNKEKLSRTHYLVDNAKKMQLMKIKNHFKRIKSHMKTRSKKATEKFEVDFRSPIEKSLGILKTLRETDEGRRLNEELEYVSSTLKKSTNNSWTPELLASAQQVSSAGTTGKYQKTVEGWLQTYRKSHAKDVVLKGKARQKAATIGGKPPELSKISFTPSGIKVIPESKEEEESAQSPKDKSKEEEKGEGKGVEEKEKATSKFGKQIGADGGKEEAEEVHPLLTWLEEPDSIIQFFGLPSTSPPEAIKKLEGSFKPYTAIGKLLGKDLGNWNLDIFKLKKLSKDRPLLYMIEQTFRELGLDMIFNIERGKLLRFADVIDRAYKNNPYHNNTHAADVLHNMFCLIKGPPLCDVLSDLEILACLYAAIIHDVGHPGVNNALMVSTSTMQAYLYHDKSVLENFHLSAGFAATRGECGILDNLTPEDFSKLRSLVIELVLATDMGNHFDLISRFNSTYDDSPEFEGESRERFALDLEDQTDKELILKIAMKVCDIAHSTKSKELHLEWSSCMQDEFFQQGDKEEHLGLQVAPLMDRKQTKEQLAHSQSGFLEFVCQPLYDSWCKFAPEYDFIIQNLEVNKKMWEDMEEDEINKKKGNSSGD